MHRRDIFGLAGWLLAVFIVATLASLASVQAASFYLQLARPAWAPPGWLFGPVWTVLYISMAVAAWLVWQRGGFRANPLVLGTFGAHLVLNVLWSWLFFVLRLGAWAFVEILCLLAALVWVIVLFWRVRPIAGALLVPYAAWVTFAAALNLAVWQMNPQVMGGT